MFTKGNRVLILVPYDFCRQTKFRWGWGGLPTAPSPPLNFFQGAFAGRKAIELILGRTESLGRASRICKCHK